MPVFAKKVEVETAKKAAKNLYYLRINQVREVKLSEINLTLAYTETVNNEPVYYVFNVNENEGFVIISADDIAKPCIGYSFEGPFVTTLQSPSFQYWMGGFRDQIAEAVSQKLPASAEITQEWVNILTKNPVIIKSKSIQPLIIHTWDQGWPYNELCPADAAGSGGHVYVGCVATAMAQVMKYYNYPATGTGSHTDYYSGYGNLYVNFANQTYVWENMPNSISASNTEVAKISYHCGVAVNMEYGPDGSGSITSLIPGALENFFRYSTACQYVQKSSYTQTAWESLLRQQIDNKWPMVYSGSGSDGGHAWNCDGYNATEFHMNWGWGGYANGFYTLDNLVAGGSDFNTSQSAVINIYPEANYPAWCTPTAKLITGKEGTFNDGSGNQNYLDNQDCLYLIQPPCATYISLSFDRFDLGTGDLVKVYDGATTGDSLIATFDASNIPSTSYVSTGPNMLIEFISDAGNNATGWYASYNTYPCLGSKILTAPSGTIIDGSQSCDYNNGITCLWYIQPAGVASFQLVFTEFSFAAGDANDYLKIYKTSATPSNLIGTYNASNIPTTLDITALKVILRFVTNSSLTSSGWALNYSTTLILSVSTTSTNDTCGNSNGTVTANPSGGTPGYTYSWSNEQITQTATGLTSGTYFVTVTDANGWSVTDSAIVSETVAPSLNPTATNSTGDCNGSATANASGGVPPYTYLWSNGQTTPTDTGLCGIATGTTYFVTVTDNNHCSADSSVIVYGTDVIEELAFFNSLSIFPNPTTGKLNIEMEITEAKDFGFKLLNINGQEIWSDKPAKHTIGKYQKAINLKKYAKGVYTLQIISSEGTINRKVAVE